MGRNSHKHIIWVEDFDNKNITLANIPTDEDWDSEEDNPENFANHNSDIIDKFGSKYSDSVRLFMNVKEALDFIENNMNFFDCVVLDVNLINALDEIDIIKEKCKKRGINIDEEKDIGKYCGYYIYLYLLKSGFPTDRICIFTGNKGEKNSTGTWEDKFLKAGIVPPKSINRNEKEKLQKWIDSCYINSYHKTRCTVYKACEHWKKWLGDINEKYAIAFNKLYYSKEDDEKSSIEADVFINMLNRVEMLYPINEPSNSNAVYYQALQVITSFHEESAKIKKINDGSKIKRYHQAVRNYRNWAAHNKFKCNEISEEMFTYIFCITLRTYFIEVDKQFCIDNVESIDCYESYEKDFFEKYLDSSLNIDKCKEKYKKAFKNHLDKVKTHDKKSLKKENKNDRIPVIYECKDINELLLCSGNICTYNMMEKMSFFDLLMNIMDYLIVQKTKFGQKNTDEGWEYKVTYYWDDSMTFDKNSISEDIFKYVAYRLFEDV